MALCWGCGDGRIITDAVNGTRVCESCGIIHPDGDFRTEAFDSDGRPTGTLIHSGDFGYRQRKIRDAKALIAELTSRLGLSASRADEAATMVSDVTDGDLGAGSWFPVLVGACSYLVMRRHRLPLSLAEVAAAVEHDVCAVGRMASRVVNHLSLDPLPDFDTGQALERAVTSCPSLAGLGKEKAKEVIGQGRFLLHCATKWFLATGRQPLPLVAAVVVFVAEVNGVVVAVEDVAREIYAGVDTSKRRLKELRETLVRAARALLPWGEDVTVKNLSICAPTLIRFMEIKSKSKSESCNPREAFGFELNDFLDAYANPEKEEDSMYYKEGISGVDWDQLGNIKLSKAAHSRTYEYLLPKLAQIKETGEIGDNLQKKRKQWGFDFNAYPESWQWEGRWDSDKGLEFNQVWQKDVGYEALPPSFVAGVEACKGRRLRIEAAKLRINEIMKGSSPGNSGLDMKERGSAAKSSGSKTQRRKLTGEDGIDSHAKKIDSPAKAVSRKRKLRGVVEDDIDWEDCLIELLLLHGVDEDEIEQGQYKRLLDLHLFSA